MFLVKMIDFCCMLCDANSATANALIFCIMAVYVNATISGWLSPDISFDTVLVER